MRISPPGEDGWAQRLQRLAHWVPGLGPYQDREGLREADQQIRQSLAGRIGELARELEGAVRSVTQAGRLERAPELDRVGRLFLTQADRIRHAAYGFTGVFDGRKVRTAGLAALHEFDLRLFDALPGLQERVRALVEAAERTAWFPQAIQAAEDAVREFERTVDGRDQAAREL